MYSKAVKKGKNMKNFVVGIDPGKKGAIAFVDKDTLEAEVYLMPQFVVDLISMLKSRQRSILLVVLEKQQPFPRQGIVSTFNLGEHYGIIKGILHTLGIPYEEISARKWQRKLLGNFTTVNHKDRRKLIKTLSLKKAKALFPMTDIGNHDGKSDALLIAEYGRRFFVVNKEKKSE